MNAVNIHQERQLFTSNLPQALKTKISVQK